MHNRTNSYVMNKMEKKFIWARFMCVTWWGQSSSSIKRHTFTSFSSFFPMLQNVTRVIKRVISFLGGMETSACSPWFEQLAKSKTGAVEAYSLPLKLFASVNMRWNNFDVRKYISYLQYNWIETVFWWSIAVSIPCRPNASKQLWNSDVSRSFCILSIR